MVSWFGEERMGTDARAPGVYITLLMLQFRVRFTTDIPVLYREVGLRESRLKAYLSIFLNDEEQMEEAADAGKGFLKAFVAHSSLPEYEEVLDSIERDFYEMFK